MASIFNTTEAKASNPEDNPHLPDGYEIDGNIWIEGEWHKNTPEFKRKRAAEAAYRPRPVNNYGV
jgi:hypothetical protein